MSLLPSPLKRDHGRGNSFEKSEGSSIPYVIRAIAGSEPITKSSMDNLWGKTIKDPATVRRAEFTKQFKEYKAAYTNVVQSPDNTITYKLSIFCERDKYLKNQQLENTPLQVVLFGTERYTGKRELSFDKQLEVNGKISAEWQDVDIGVVVAAAIGYEPKDQKEPLYIDYMKLKVAGSTFEIPCYRWFSSEKEDFKAFRFLWVYPKTLVE